MPGFVAALVVAPSLSSSSLVGSSSLLGPPSSSIFDRRKSISGAVAQRQETSPPPPPSALKLSSPPLPTTTTTPLLSPPAVHPFGSRPSSPGKRTGRRSSPRPKTSESLGAAQPATTLVSSFSPPLDGNGSDRAQSSSERGGAYSEDLIRLLREASLPGSYTPSPPSLAEKGSDRPKPFIYPIPSPPLPTTSLLTQPAPAGRAKLTSPSCNYIITSSSIGPSSRRAREEKRSVEFGCEFTFSSTLSFLEPHPLPSLSRRSSSQLYAEQSSVTSPLLALIHLASAKMEWGERRTLKLSITPSFLNVFADLLVSLFFFSCLTNHSLYPPNHLSDPVSHLPRQSSPSNTHLANSRPPTFLFFTLSLSSVLLSLVNHTNTTTTNFHRTITLSLGSTLSSFHPSSPS